MQKVFIIAEAGVNHNGSLSIAKKMVDAAVIAKVDAIKFQSFSAESLVTKDIKMAEYQQSAVSTHQTQFELLKNLELSHDEQQELYNYCISKNITFMSSPFDIANIDFLAQLGVSIFKVPSGEITNIPYLRALAKYNKPVVLSTGMSSLDEIKLALKTLIDSGTNKRNITILHANTQYPTPMVDVNLRAMQTIANEFDVDVGYSDHTLGIEIPIAAVALGAKVIEKHFTLDTKMPGPDHKASLTNTELTTMVKAIRNIEAALGDGLKSVSASEKPNLEKARKYIVAAKNIAKGDLLTEQNLTTKRAGAGKSAVYWDEVVGIVANRDYSKDEVIID